jgi:hypothetical protein
MVKQKQKPSMRNRRNSPKKNREDAEANDFPVIATNNFE